MITPNYPSSGDLIVTFLDNVRRYRVNSVRGVNPTLINVNGELMYIYIKNLSPAQLSNDNPDIWRIQLPKRKEFEDIKNSDHMFLLFGYDYVRKVYTTWNPYWCKQRLNIAESCSMYSRLSLQVRVASTQKIEKLQLQNDGDVLCIPASLLANYLKNIKDYYPAESIYVPVGSSIQKRVQIDNKEDLAEQKTDAEILFNKFWGCYKASEFRSYLQDKGYYKNTVLNYVTRIDFILDKGYITKYKHLFLECTKLEEYKRAINRFCWQPEIRYYEDLWHKAIMASMKQYLLFVEKKLYGCQNIRVKKTENDDSCIKIVTQNKQSQEKIEQTPTYKLDQYGKLVSLDPYIIEKLVPLIKGVDYPDYGNIIQQIKAYYSPEITEKMTPADWFVLFNSTKWQKRRGRKSKAEVIIVNDDNGICDLTVNEKNDIVSIDNSSTVSHHDDNEIKTQSFDIPKTNDLSIDIEKFNKVFEKKATSYKYFWLIAIISLAKEKDTTVLLYKDILIRMASLAWPIVLNDRIELGASDMMKNILTNVQKSTHIIDASSPNVVEKYLSNKYFMVFGTLSQLLKNVPYRFLSPWIKYTNNDEVVEKSKSDYYMGLYELYDDGINLKNEWWDYIDSHYDDVCNFVLNSFIIYAQNYNNDIKLLRLKREGWCLSKLQSALYYPNTHDNSKKTESKKESKIAENNIDVVNNEFSVKIGDRLKLFPSQLRGMVIRLRKDSKGHRIIVVQLDNGETKEVDDNKYLYQKIYDKSINAVQKESKNTEIDSYLKRTSNSYGNRSTNRKVKVGDWIQIKSNNKFCKVVKIDKFGTSFDKLVLEFKDGHRDWILNNPDLYYIVL